MKKIFLLVMLGLLFLTYNSHAQTCLSTGSNQYNYSMNNSQMLSGGVTGPLYIKVYIHLLRLDNGTGGINLLQLEQSKGYLNRAFAPHNIFFVYDCYIDQINSTNYYTGAQMINLYCTLGSTNAHTDGIDVYIGGDDSSPFYVAGNIPGKFLLVRGTAPTTGPNGLILYASRNNTIAHEMGHCFGLFHTHHGSEAGGSACGGSVPGGTCLEFVNGSNGNTCGDFVADSPADPNMAYGVTASNCQWFNSANDPNGDPYNPDELNIMSASNSFCLQYFSAGQGERMRNIIASDPILQARLTTAPPYSSVTSLTVNTTWNTSQTINSDVVIEPSVTLTINNGAVINFQNNSHLVVKPSAKLIIDNATLTTTSNTLWQGIKVLGISTQHQYPAGAPTYQGYIELKNGAVIENSINAISTWDESCMTSSTGGVIVAQNSIFRNNKRDVEFLKYQNFNPSNPSQLRANLSYFRNCQFVTSANLKGGVNPNSHITMWNVDGIRFYGCTFENTNPSAASNETLGTGIYTEDANFLVSACDWGLVGTCAPGICCYPAPNVFRNLYCGIWTKRLGGTLYNYSVDKNSFINCSTGIYNEAVDNAILTRNNFTIGKPRFALWWTTGIAFNAGTNFRIEENIMVRDALPNTFSIGTWLGTTGMNNNQAYLNSFTNLNIGNYAYLRNRGYNAAILTYTGLGYLCNKHYTLANNDISIYGTDPINDGVRQHQGALNGTGNGASKSAGNIFTRSGVSAESDIANPNTPSITYYYDGSALLTNPKYPFYVTAGNKVARTFISTANTCPSNFSGGGSGKNSEESGMAINDGKLSASTKQELIAQFDEHGIALTQSKSLYLSMLDGGNTNQLKAEVENSSQSETWQLRQNLLGKSPYLSKEVLKESSDKTNVLPDAVLFEILSANPDAVKDEELVKHLSEKINPLPEWMIELLKNSSDQITSRTILESNISYHKSQQDLIASFLIQDILTKREDGEEMNHQELRSWLATYKSAGGDYQIVDDFFETGDYSSGLSLLSTVPGTYKLNEKEQKEFEGMSSLFNTLSNVHSSGRNIRNLTESEINSIQDIADNGEGIAKVRACNLISSVTGVECNYNFRLPEESNQSFKTDKQIAPKKNPLLPSINVFPNPAKDYVEFSFTLPISADEGTLTISNVTGVIVHQQQLNSKYGQVAVDTREWSQGTYAYSLTSNGKTVSNQKFVIAK